MNFCTCTVIQTARRDSSKPSVHKRDKEKHVGLGHDYRTRQTQSGDRILPMELRVDRVVGQPLTSMPTTARATRAKAFALAAFQILRRRPEFHLILTTSGSDGWHLFVFSAEFHPVADWVLLLKRVVDEIGAEIKTGICEIFPNETRNGSRPHAIRAPGTWNPKTNQVGAIFFESIRRASSEGKKERRKFFSISFKQRGKRRSVE